MYRCVHIWKGMMAWSVMTSSILTRDTILSLLLQPSHWKLCQPDCVYKIEIAEKTNLRAGDGQLETTNSIYGGSLIAQEQYPDIALWSYIPNLRHPFFICNLWLKMYINEPEEDQQVVRPTVNEMRSIDGIQAIIYTYRCYDVHTGVRQNDVFDVFRIHPV